VGSNPPSPLKSRCWILDFGRRSLSNRWAISTFKRYSFIVRTPRQLSRHCETRACLVRHRKGDVDFRLHLYQFFPQVTNVNF
jgi:hypothetical protein